MRHFATFIPFRSDLKGKARGLRHDPTPAEKKLYYEVLKGKKPRFLRQKPIGPYIADFYCSQAKLVIEVDGDSHFEDNALVYDSKRDDYMKGLCLTTLRFTNLEIIDGIEQVAKVINDFLLERGFIQPSQPPFSREE